MTLTRFDDNENQLWVTAPDTGSDTESGSDADEPGTYERPYPTIAAALEKVGPGNTIVLKNGCYRESISVHTPGELKEPIRITAEEKGGVRIEESSWYFYDIHDWIIDNFDFVNSSRTALALIGACQRNSCFSLRFMDRAHDKAASAIFFGGTRASCNKIENCEFMRQEPSRESNERGPDHAHVAIMVSEGNPEDNEKNSDFIIRHNRISHYDYGIIVGTSDFSRDQHAHLIEENQISHCRYGGITVKSGDTRIRANLLSHCGTCAIAVKNCDETKVEHNRILETEKGVLLTGSSHTCHGNCLIRCSECGIEVAADADVPNKENIMISHNSFINCAPARARNAGGISCDKDTTCIVFKNLFHESYPEITCVSNMSHRDEAMHVVRDNLVSSPGDTAQTHQDPATAENGIVRKQVTFGHAAHDDYSTGIEYGAYGCSVTPFSVESYGIREQKTSWRRSETEVLEQQPQKAIERLESFFSTDAGTEEAAES